ncbi:MAG: acylneuraminate cytidylyltransferase family protein [Erysipelotrichales bacterium]|nr:acylneuraminate cytidylyltransferase family protein [Erysipelotrichales bacterium]
MNILCTICCRSGSQGVKDKNIREVNGKPLMAYTIEQATKWNGYTDFVISTDSKKYQEIAEVYGCSAPFTRPNELADSKSGKVAVIRHALETMENLNGITYDYIVDLDATSPFREIADIEAAVRKCIDNDLDIVYSVCEARKNPYFNMVELDENGFPHLSKKLPGDVLSRQAAPKVYELNASIYVYKRDYLKTATTVFSDKAGIIVMKDESIDIDSENDLKYMEYILRERGNH